MIGLGAFFSGLGRVIRAPFTFAAVLLLTVITVIPFGLVMGSRLQAELNGQPPIALGAEEIDADWWLEFRRHAEGLNATFTPAIIGFAAPLSNLSHLLDGTPQGVVMALPIALAILTWAFIWGLAIERFRDGGSRSAAAQVSAGLRSWPRFAGISVAAVVAQLALYVTIHPLLFRVLFPAITASMANERNAFVVRVLLYVIFGVFLIAVSLAADYTRIASSFRGGVAVGDATSFIRRHLLPVTVLFLTTTTILGVLMVLYGVGESYGGSRVAGWRGVAIGQAFVMARLAMRLVSIAGEVKLFEQLTQTGTRARTPTVQ
jgi:hypothetical protein